MSSERGGLLKTRAENFAHHLQNRLRNLSDTDDNSWATEVSSSSDTEIYYDIDSSLASPDEEVAEPIFIAAKNRDSPSLHRGDSNASQYFDTVDTIEQLTSSPVSPVPTSRQIPILHLKTDRPTTITNGHMNLLDADSGCSRVREMPYLELETQIGAKDVTENNCDNESLDNNTYEVIEEISDIKQCGADSCDVSAVEVDTRPVRDELPGESTEEESESFCVFCDIEQIKTSLSKGTEYSNLQEGNKNGHCETSELGNEPQRLYLKVPISSEPNNINEFLSDEESISLPDLLQVLKQELTIQTDQKKEISKPKSIENDNSSESDCPCIEVQESSPLASDAKTKEAEEEEVYDIEMKRKNFRRSSSLKSGKTPPGTPGRKKFVRFADVLGLDLADVKTFLDEVPTVPKSAYSDLHGIELSSSPVVESPLSRITSVMPQPQKILVPLFQQPGVQPNFLDRVRENNVCLESAFVSDPTLFAVSGMVRVKNIDFHKSVYVRYTIDNWINFSDLQAKYVPNSCDGFSDKFSFVLYAHTLGVGQQLQFAIRFHSSGAQFWDANGGDNYKFECTTQVSDPCVPPSPMGTWASFY